MGRKARRRIANIFIIASLLLLNFPTGIIVEAAEKEDSPAVNGKSIGAIKSIQQQGNTISMDLSTGEGIEIKFLKENVFRFHLDPSKSFPEYPTPNSKDHITTIVDKDVDDYKEEYGEINVKLNDMDPTHYIISTDAVELKIEKQTSKMSLYDKKNSKTLWSEAEPLKYEDSKMVQTLATNDDEYFYGGGQQNGYYSHKNQRINIAIGGGWDAGAASSPVPFYLSTEGYGVMRNTFKPGVYDFSKTATFTHNENRFDAYYFVEDSIPDIINEYTELTGKPALMPEYAFYLGHADCFNGKHNGHGDQRTLMENGLNYLKDYGKNDMPLGWFLPNDGYSCGYGGVDNLEGFANAASEEGVVTGLWTQNQLTPDPSLPPESPLRRDLEGEVKAGTRAIKTDVAWVGHGYSMALDATRQAAEGIENYSPEGARPFVITVDGWAGTQRYSTLWSGDQYGGNWEYIRMHIPTYIGAGLSGNPYIGSDMDGIFGGNKVIQTRDHQWKAFTPVQIDMDGWASGIDKTHEKNPWNYGEPYTSINRMYLKLKAEMMPYIYSIAKESTSTSMPMVRGMMLEYPNDSYTYGTETQYQYMWGPNLLVAPIYKESDNDAGVRNGIYLPDENQVWIDYFTGETYKGGVVINNFEAPLWKTPVFVKAGAIIPMAPENNSILELGGSENRIFDVYPSGKTEFTMYEDDGKTVEYKKGKSMQTKITSSVDKEQATITVGKASGSGYKDMIKERGTEFIINTHKIPDNLVAKVGTKDIRLTKAANKAEYESLENAYFYDEKPNLNKYATKGSEFEKTDIITTPKLYVKVEKTDVTANTVSVTVDGFSNEPNKEAIDKEIPAIPTNLSVNDESVTDREVKLEWDKVAGENVQYDVMVDGVIHTNIFVDPTGKEIPNFVHADLKSDTEYVYQIRAVNTKGASEWSGKLVVKTKLDRFRNVPKNMTAKASSNQPGQGAENAVDGDENTVWHTQWGTGNVPPHTFELDMKLAYDLDKFEYLPRPDTGNGTILKYDLDVSLDGKTYKNVVKNGSFARNNQLKTIAFNETVYARYIKLTITEAVGGYGSAQEFRPYKKDKTEGWVVGKNISDGADGQIGEDDLNFFASYMGVDETDTSWNQVVKGDINYNGVIDAYDLMYVASQLGENPLKPTGKSIKGTIGIVPNKKEVKKGEEFTLDVIGENLEDINAFGIEISLDLTKYELVRDSIHSTDATKHMLNYSKLIEKGADSRIMVALSNKGTQKTIEGTQTLATLTLKAREGGKVEIPTSRIMLLNTSFKTIETLQDKEENTRVLTNKDIKVKGDGSKMQGGNAAFAKLIDGDKSENSLAELVWNNTESSGVKLPLDVQFEFNSPQEITMFEVFNRPVNTNGKIKKLSAKGLTEDGSEYQLGTKTVASNDQSVIFNLLADKNIPDKTLFTKIEIVFEESHSGPLMLSVAEAEFSAIVQVNKGPLETAVSKAEAINTDQYTEESVTIFTEKLEQARIVLADEKVHQDAVDKALVDLEAAMNGLVEKVPEVVENVDGLKKLVEDYKNAGEFSNEDTASKLDMHLTAVGHYKQQGKDDKAVKHLNGFLLLIDQQRKSDFISDAASKAIRTKAEKVLELWQKDN